MSLFHPKRNKNNIKDNINDFMKSKTNHNSRKSNNTSSKFVKIMNKTIHSDIKKGIINVKLIENDVCENCNVDDLSVAQRIMVIKTLDKMIREHSRKGYNGINGQSPLSISRMEKKQQQSHATKQQMALANKYHMNPTDLISGLNKDGLKQLNEMIGLNSVKEQMRRFIISAMVDKRAEKLGQNSTLKSLNMVFMGNPGTGKTVVARLVGKILFQHHILKKPLFKECSSKDLISPLVGGSAISTHRIVASALGGVLFIDEAYNLTPDSMSRGESSSKKSAVSELLRLAENNRDNIVIILAGYPDKMEELMQKSNEGLKSRFNHKIIFPDYTNKELGEIFDFHAKRNYCTYDSDDVKEAVHNKIGNLNKIAKKHKDDSNGRLARNLLQFIIGQRNLRNGQDINNIKHLNLKQINTIKMDDVNNGFNDAIQNEKNS